MNAERHSLQEFCRLSAAESLQKFCRIGVAIRSMRDFCRLSVGDTYWISVSLM